MIKRNLSVIVAIIAVLGPVGYAIASNTIKTGQLEDKILTCYANKEAIVQIQTDIRWIKKALEKMTRR